MELAGPVDKSSTGTAGPAGEVHKLRHCISDYLASAPPAEVTDKTWLNLYCEGVQIRSKEP
jgi:hypothetical protein